MGKRIWAVMVLFLLFNAPGHGDNSPWGKNYFPNVPLVTQDGQTVLFFDDLIKNKVVCINFIYTTCPDSCPLETAQLVKVQQILGDRLGTDVFFYSITIDPEQDSPTVLKQYRERFGARWTFLTGKNSDIIELRKTLGLYIEEIQDGSNNHNLSMIIGNQRTGRWMKRSPFENPYVLADQIGNWLTDWKQAAKGDDYANAPRLRNIPRGEQLFRTRCANCHSLTGKESAGALGPDLLGVTQRREINWLLDWLKAPEQMLAKQDPIAIALFKQYNNVAMPNMRLNQQEGMDLIEYLDAESQRLAATIALTARPPLPSVVDQKQAAESVVVIRNPWIRQSDPGSEANAGYMTLINSRLEDVTLIKVESDVFEKIEVHEMAMVDGLMTMRKLNELTIPANGLAQLAPGGKHLMMKSPVRHLTAGQEVNITLNFETGYQQTFSATVMDK